ncbi:MAG: DUF5317 domain-containing protein [Actinomycetota bacterium]|nr:DUF5317 domain-containing protein [Actinomycetota bacterium]MDH5225457.1 DUF5317 domain-containing protein [Actinomycetota bacterium]MDH5313104.1 DUF5317 domain-containing protein [Actinomycetota bacterium]
MAISLCLALLTGVVLRGRLHNLSSIHLRWTGLAIAGFALQWVSGPGTTIPLTCLYASFVLLTIFAIKNIQITGFAVILLGISMNFLVIGLNQGMPVARQALIASGQSDTLDDLINNPWPKHHLKTGDDTVGFLGDVIALPQPVGQAVSIGDFFTYGGVGIVIVAGMLGPAARREDEGEASDDAPTDEGAMQGAGG